MPERLYLPGEVIGIQSELDRLSEINATLSEHLQHCRETFATVQAERDALLEAMKDVRNMLAPFYKTLRILFNDFDSAIAVTGFAQPSVKIESAKRRMPGKPSEFIDLLLEHGPMNLTNFVTLAKCSKQTAYNTLSKLSQAGIVQSSGGKYFLKE